MEAGRSPACFFLSFLLDLRARLCAIGRDGLEWMRVGVLDVPRRGSDGLTQ